MRSAAGADRPAGRAELAAVLVDHGCVAALLAAPAVQRAVLHAVARFDAIVLGDLEHAHLGDRVAALVEHPEHGVAVDDESRAVGHGAGEVVLALLARRSEEHTSELQSQSNL